MFRWCSFCYHYLGEKAPFDDISFTHGICPSCAERYSDFSLDEIHEANAFSRLLREYAHGVGEISLAEVLQRSEERRVVPSHLFLGLVQPLLHEIGRAFEAGTVSIAIEQRFSSLVNNLADFVEQRNPMPPPAAGRRVLFATAPGNRHFFGIKFLAQEMREFGFYAVCVWDEDDPRRILERIRSEAPTVVGFSICLPQQKAALVALIGEVNQLSPAPLRIVIGGQGMKSFLADTLPRNCFLAPDTPQERHALFTVNF